MSALGDFFNPGQVAARKNTDLARQYASGADFTPYNVSSGLGTASMGAGGASFGLSGPLAGISGAMAGVDPTATGFTTAQQGMFDQLRNIGLTGLQDATSQQYGLMSQMAAPGMQRERAAMEARLASQGMLGASGGAQRMGGLLEAQNMRDLGMQQQAFGQALQGRQQDIGLFGAGLEMAEQERQLLSPERQMQLLMQQGMGISGLESLPMQYLGGFARTGFGAEQLRQQQLLQAQMAQNTAEAQTAGILPNLLLQGAGAGIGSLTGGAGLFGAIPGLFSGAGQTMGIGGQTGYYGGASGVLSGAEWERF